jgi:drug/metabolite transporter (DMT)-like permease
MFWAILAFIGACTNAAYYISNKKFLERISPLPLAAGGFLATAAILLIISFVRGFPETGPWLIPAVFATSILNIAATTITFRALTSSDISRAVPMLAFTPVFLIGTAAVILHEFPSLIGIAGIGVIVAGSYVLNTDPAHEGLVDPFRDMARHPGVLAMLVVAFLYAVAINFDKIIVENSDIVFGEAIAFLCIGTGFAVMHAVSVRIDPDTRTGANTGAAGCNQGDNPGQECLGNMPWYRRYRDLILASLFTAILISIEAVVINTAYTLQIGSYVIAIKRMSTLLVVGYGVLVFGEKGIVRTFSGAALMCLGAVLILFFP